jgi:hypothetical protein
VGDDAVHRVGEGGLAAARRAGDADEAAVGNGQVDVPHHQIGALAVTEAEISELDHDCLSGILLEFCSKLLRVGTAGYSNSFRQSSLWRTGRLVLFTSRVGA